MISAPPILTHEFRDAMLAVLWTDSRLYYYWQGRYQPIEDEL